MGLFLKARRSWQLAFLLSPQRCLCRPAPFTYQGLQYGDRNIRGYKGPDSQDVGLYCSCSHQLRFRDTLGAEARSSNKILGSCSGGQCVNNTMTMDCCPRPSKTSFTFECAPSKKSNALGKTSSKILVFGASSSAECFINSLPQSRRICLGLKSWIRRNPPCIGSRSFFSVGNDKTSSDGQSKLSEDSVVRLAAALEVDTNASSSQSEEDFDFRNFPALTSSHFQDYERPVEMQVKKRVTWQTRSKVFNTDTKLSEDCIPKPKGRTYDFGFGDILSKPPPLEEGARPQGGFDTDISLGECEAASSEAPLSCLSCASGMPMRRSNLQCDIPEADNWSEVIADAQIPEDSVQKPDHEIWSDPYDFDVNVKVKSFSANFASQ